MRLSSGFIPTLKEEPSDAVMPSHKLMIRAGMVRPLAAGVYSFLPLGWRVAQKVMQIIREEMNAIGGQEFHLPALNPIELWEETGRLRDFGDVIFQLKNRPLVLAPTHEEVICYIAKHHIKSYKDLPQIWYQIQTKFRNEPRPRSGVIRGRQFIMKDSYSLDASWEGLDRSYELHRQAYIKIYTRCGLKFFIVGASTGAMGGSASEEFMVESPYGEDTVVICDRCGYAANTEIAQSNVQPAKRYPESKPLEEIYTPNVRTINELAQFLNVSTDILAKSLVYKHNGQPVLILMLGNDQLVEAKLLKALGGGEIAPMEPEELKELTGANAGSIGPIGLKNFKIIADNRLRGANNLISGANKDDYHIANIDMERDVKVDGYFDLRKVEEGEPCINCSNPLRIVNAIEVGHIFKLGTKYSEAMKATFLDENGQEKPIIMGSYGIGVERIIACHIEQNHDENGIIWDKSIAPFHVHLISVNTEIPSVVETAEKLYDELNAKRIETIYDDRTDVTPGFKFKDADLLGMPLQVIVSERNLKNGQIEIKIRRTGERILVNLDDVIAKIKEILEL
ncbi:prolyl-tRNA synthetase [Candidatus Thermokryptus mobilis]|uniref:Proline--tRNA ligase n=1 Tax=Candidatus Thermokryptus mobilis TaxID=1643428 RepID=A0A0S4ND42_9BACT|nr:proline--tRNA ligase [Candidatus Thermokryptus mobilis]CUU09106.1 prolyl-tRNA synthetase [Candidatus Thermokryptus mobilis]